MSLRSMARALPAGCLPEAPASRPFPCPHPLQLTLDVAGTTRHRRDAPRGSPAGCGCHKTAGSGATGQVSYGPENGLRRDRTPRLVGGGRRAVRGLRPWPSFRAAPASALGRTCCGEGPGACTVALVQRLMDQVGPLLRGLEGCGQHLPGAQHCLQSKSQSICLLPLPWPTLQGPVALKGPRESRAFCGLFLSIPAAEGFRQSPH